MAMTLYTTFRDKRDRTRDFYFALFTPPALFTVTHSNVCRVAQNEKILSWMRNIHRLKHDFKGITRDLLHHVLVGFRLMNMKLKHVSVKFTGDRKSAGDLTSNIWCRLCVQNEESELLSE